MSSEADRETANKAAGAAPPREEGPPSEDFTPPAGVAEPDAPEIIRKLQSEKKVLMDQLLRKQAEAENVRKRAQREKEEIAQYNLFRTMESLLPVLDGFELALASNGSGEEYRQGVELIHQQLFSALQKLGLETIATQGHLFDPHVHEAVVTVETSEYADQQILEELQRGYYFKQRLLRPARVKVAKRLAAPAADEGTATPADA